MKSYQLIFTLFFSVALLSIAGCGAKSSKNNGSATTGTGDTARNDLAGARTCTGNPPSGRTILNKWSFKKKVKEGTLQMDMNISSGLTLIAVTCISGTQTKILSDSVPSHVVNNQFVISDHRNQNEMVGKMNCDLAVAPQTWNYTLAGECLILTSGKQSRNWVKTN